MPPAVRAKLDEAERRERAEKKARAKKPTGGAKVSPSGEPVLQAAAGEEARGCEGGQEEEAVDGVKGKEDGATRGDNTETGTSTEGPGPGSPPSMEESRDVEESKGGEVSSSSSLSAPPLKSSAEQS